MRLRRRATASPPASDVRETPGRVAPATDLAAASSPGSLLRGHVDEPGPGDIAGTGSVVVRGWHTWGDEPALAVAVAVSGRVAGAVAVGSELRPDVAHALGIPGLVASGWRMVVGLAGLQGEAVLEVSVWPAADVAPIVLPTITVRLEAGAAGSGQPDRFLGELDDPGQGEAVPAGHVRVTGWALTEREPTRRVELVVEGLEAGRARIGLARPEVARRLRVPHAEISGFEGLVDLSHFVPAAEGAGETAEVEVEARAWSLEGVSEVVASRRVTVHRPAPVSAAPTHHTGELAGLVRPAEGDLNLVCFTHDLGLGGGQLWLSELLRRASAGSAFPCTVVAPAPGPLMERFEAQGIGVHLTGETPVKHVESYEGRVRETATFCARHGYNAALVNTFGAFMGTDIATRLGLGSVWAIHESWTPDAIWSVAYGAGVVDPAIPATVATAMRSVGALVFEADETRRQYADAAGPDRTMVVPYGVDVAAIEEYAASTSRAEARRALGLPDGSRVLLVLGTTEPRKAQTVLAAAFAQVAGEHPDALLVFVGDTGTAYSDALRGLMRSMHIEDQTRLEPVVEDVYQWYRAADVLVCASDVESLPRSVLEAMGFGVPILATAVFGLPELLTDGETGYLFEPLDLGAVIDALRRVLTIDAESLAKVGDAGRRLVVRDYDSAGYARDIVALLEGLRRSPESTPREILAATSHRVGAAPRD